MSQPVSVPALPLERATRKGRGSVSITATSRPPSSLAFCWLGTCRSHS